MLELTVLGVLADQELHGYELKKRLTELLGTMSSVSFGSLYPALNRLERTGQVAVVEAESDTSPIPTSGSLTGEVAAYRARRGRTARGRRGKKVYSITPSGRARLRDLLLDHTGDDRSFSIRVAFCRHLNPQDRIDLFQRRRTEVAAQLAERSASRSDRRIDKYLGLLREHHDEALERDLAWLDRLVSEERQTQSDAQPEHEPSGGSRT
ncbi:MAG: hypothetical protein JJLCMIEE_01419 [Acidimicrobiales bacterium]|nr:hypothetical protein [Acidimicrobiales bacterium]